MKSASAVELGPVALPRLRPHTSKLPNLLYILSFAPPVPSPLRPRAFFSHPYILYAIAFPCGAISGVCMPAYDIIFGHWTNGIKNVNAAPWYLVSQGSVNGWRITMVGCVALLSTAGFQYCCTCARISLLSLVTLAGYKLSRNLRETYLSAVIVQDQAFLDRVGPGEIISRSTKDIELVRVGLGERLGYLTHTLATILSAFVVAFITLPKLAGVLFALIPFTFLLFTGVGYWAKNAADAADTLEGKTASYVEQILSSLRIVQSFNMSERLLLKLQYGYMKPLRKLSLIKTTAKGADMGVMYGAGLLSYSMAFWYGGVVVTEGYTIGAVLTVFYNYVNLCFSFGGVMPHLIATITALHSLSKLRMQIERKPIVDVREATGITLADYNPSFGLEDVTFAYPARPSIKALDNASISIPPGKFTAVVGPSGSGKSTMASLLLRMYDPTTAMTITDVDRQLIDELDEKVDVTHGAGIVRFAGRDVRDLDVMWLRRQVAVVWQNPQLISGTIYDNVAIGLTGQVEEYSEKGTSTEMDIRVEEALRTAQAWDFVTALPEGLQTKVSAGRTGVLSGGQVQRIALARALVRRPRCLLLDEATSAVSADTEQLIQESLLREQKKHGMTLIVIAHRLSTVVAADKIIVMVGGKPVVEGTYDALMDPDCPDQTFRSMALPHQRQHTPEESKAPSRTETIEPALVPHMDDLKPQRLPPPLKSVRQAFLHVAYLLGGGILVGLVGGVAFVLCGFLFGRAAAALNNPVFSVMREQVNRWSLWFLIVAIGTIFTIGFHAFALEFSGERMVAEFRREIVRAFVRQETAFFETEATSSGSLTAAAAQHPSNVGAFVGLVLSQIVISFANLIGTLVLALSLDWRIGIMAFPSLAFSTTLGYLNFRFSGSYENDITEDGNQQAKFVGESVNSLALIAASTMEAETVRQFSEKFCSTTPSKGKLFGTAATFGGGMASGFFFGGLLFWWGSLQVSEGNTSLANLWSTFEATIIAMYVSSKVFTYLGDMTRMIKSLRTMQVWLKRTPDYATKPAGLPPLPPAQGIVFDEVELRYPSRKDVLALNKVSLRMEPGKSYAFCGTSGAGKSTILAVLQRFYDITAGQVQLDGRDLRDMNVDELRNQMGYVSQEAILFEETIRWNLTSGAIDPKSVTQEDLDWACEQACILSFIRSLPEGFETDLGTKGGQLSGGQRQRLCIARALLRRPKILLLDEATSALDGESEAHVQRAIDNASKDRTVITVAHRLSTIRKADVIYVMENGQVVESGSHEELLDKKGRYYELVQVQL